MHAFKRFPSRAGRNPWFELSQYKDHRFNSISELKKSYDFVIVGAGFGGVMAAFRLVENDPSASVAIFDALPVGMYSSGRNAGFVSSALLLKALVGRARFTMDDQRQLLKFNRAIIKKLDDMRQKHSLKYEWRHDGMYKAVREKSNQKKLDELARYFDALGIDHSWVEGDDLERRLGTPFYRKALYTSENYLDNPSEFIRGLATALPENVEVFEEQPVLEVRDGARPEVALPGGQVVKAGKIFLTCNEFIKETGIGGVSNLCAIHSFGAMTRELSDEEMGIFKGVRPWG
ncbi:MAG: NAD(P)/FAD-dependent oxidoreductase [Succinivibrio sp.]